MEKQGNNDFVVIFDLDYTLWPFWVDTHISPPFHVKTVKESGENILEDGYGFEIKLYPGVFQILQKAKKDGIKMGTVSRTLEPEYGKQLLRLMDLEKYFV
jgi:magnesium-dependent phosphatase 1